MIDKKQINERKAALMAHIDGCECCWKQFVNSLCQSPLPTFHHVLINDCPERKRLEDSCKQAGILVPRVE